MKLEKYLPKGKLMLDILNDQIHLGNGTIRLNWNLKRDPVRTKVLIFQRKEIKYTYTINIKDLKIKRKLS